jgi:hypothetical protein
VKCRYCMTADLSGTIDRRAGARLRTLRIDVKALEWFDVGS